MKAIRGETRRQCIPALKAIPNLISFQCVSLICLRRHINNSWCELKTHFKESAPFVCATDD